MSKKTKYYDIHPIKEKHALYNVIFSGRSNGKTYAVIYDALENYFKTGKQLAVIRRWDEDFTGANSARTLYNSLMNNGNGDNVVLKLSEGEYNGVEYYAGRFFLTYYDDEKGRNYRSDKVVAYAFALTQSEHYKSGSWPDITTVLFDEFITKGQYLNDEFIIFQNMLSTIIRQRDDVVIYMCGNTINRYNPYFGEMGLYNANTMQQGTIDVYSYGDSGLTCAVEFADMPVKTNKANKYFAFNNSKLKQITEGQWELDIYPHKPCELKYHDCLFTYFVLFNGQTMQCEVYSVNSMIFTYVHIKTGDIKYPDNDLVYSLEPCMKPNYIQSFVRPRNKTQQKILQLYKDGKMCYQSNEVGELFNNYVLACE